MRKALFLILCSLSVGPVGAQKLTIDKQTIDIGRTGYEVPVTATFEMKNEGSRSSSFRT